MKYALWSFIFAPVTFFLALVILITIAVLGFNIESSKVTMRIIGIPWITIFIWTQISLQAAKIRDIGWKPGVIIPTLLLIDAADLLLAYLVPTLAIENKHFTFIAITVNCIATAAFAFTPSNGGNRTSAIILPDIKFLKLGTGTFQSTGSNTATRAKPPVSSASALSSAEAQKKVTFGRRGIS